MDTFEDVLIETWQDNYKNEIVSPTDEAEISEFNDMAKELGFDNLILDRKANPEQTRLPRLNQHQIRVYKTVCPNSVKLESYTEEMPLRVLKALKLAKTMVPENWDFYVWKATEDPDPVLVASRYSWSDKAILIARWGTELLSFNELEQRAEEILIGKLKTQALKIKAFLNTFEEDPKAYADGILQGEIKIPEFKEKNID